jgi:hypothetical protein
MRFDCLYLPVFLAFLLLSSDDSLLVLSLTLLFGKTVKRANVLKSILVSFECPFFFRVVLERFNQLRVLHHLRFSCLGIYDWFTRFSM